MMVPELEEALPPGAAHERTATSGPSGHTPEVPEGRAPLCGAYTSRADQERAEACRQGAAAAAEGTESDVVSEDASSHSGDEREHAEEVDSDTAKSVQSPSSAVLDGDQPEHDQGTDRDGEV